MKLEIYSDGSATTNDKPGGYGYAIVVNDVLTKQGNGAVPNSTNNDMELEAAIQGLLQAKNIIYENPYQFDSDSVVTLISDSQLILGWITGRFQFKQQAKLEKYRQLMGLVMQLRVKTQWVEGHTGNKYNELCDQLANEARKTLIPQEAKDEIKPIKSTRAKKSKIGLKTENVMHVWHNQILKVIDFDKNIVEDYDESVHGIRSSNMELGAPIK